MFTSRMIFFRGLLILAQLAQKRLIPWLYRVYLPQSFFSSSNYPQYSFLQYTCMSHSNLLLLGCLLGTLWVFCHSNLTSTVNFISLFLTLKNYAQPIRTMIVYNVTWVCVHLFYSYFSCSPFVCHMSCCCFHVTTHFARFVATTTTLQH